MKQFCKIDLYEYLDYRNFLRDLYHVNKLQDERFSYRSFALKIGFKSQSTLLMIIKGQRSLSLKSVAKLSKGIKLTENEETYFEILVKFNNETDDVLKKKNYLELLGTKDKMALSYLQLTQFKVLSSWYYLAIYVLIGTRDFSENTDFSQKLNGALSKQKAIKAVSELIEIGLIKVVNGNLKQSQGAITIDDATRSEIIKVYHENMIKKSLESLKLDDCLNRDFNGVTFSIPKDKYSIIVEKIRNFRKDINETTSSLENSTEVYHLNLNLFPLTKVNK